MTDILVSAEWLASNLDGVRIFDVSNHLPTADRRAVDEFEEAHIPGAARFDIDRIADPDSPLPPYRADAGGVRGAYAGAWPS